MRNFKISESVQKLSFEGCVSILEDIDHVVMNSFYDLSQTKKESLKEMKEVIQININNGFLDEIEILIVLSGE
jgi:hypothetical protein